MVVASYVVICFRIKYVMYEVEAFVSIRYPPLFYISVQITQVNMRGSSVQITKSILFSFYPEHGDSRFLHNMRLHNITTEKT
jgi:hypothetical protein